MHTSTNVLNEEVSQVEHGAPLPGSRRVLLIEDNPNDALLIQIMLSEAGADHFYVEHRERLAEGLKRVAQGGISLILLDLSLPDSQGLETFTRLHAAAPRVPIIVLSGLNDTTLAVEAVHEGAQDYLIKGDVEGELLVRAMRYAIERERMSEQLGRYAEELRSKNAQLEADFNMAREIQQIFLPNQYPTFPPGVAPQQSALRFAHRYLPAAAVGGDFFDIFPISNTVGGVFICDVMGHGMRAALVTAIMRGLVEELMPVAGDAGKFVTELNRSLCAVLKRTRDPFLATAFYLVADMAGGEVHFASAGHPSPLLVRREAQTVERLKLLDPRHGPAVGLFNNAVYPTCRYPMAARDLLLLFTDGLYEVDNPQHEEYGQERLLAAVKQRARLPTEQMLDELLEDVRRFSRARDFTDDVCVVAVELDPHEVQASLRFNDRELD